MCYAQQRCIFGKTIAEHQAIAFQSVEMTTKAQVVYFMLVNTAWLKDSGECNDLAADMAKYLASEFCSEITQQGFRMHGGDCKDDAIEQLICHAPFLFIGEGTSEVQESTTGKRLLNE